MRQAVKPRSILRAFTRHGSTVASFVTRRGDGRGPKMLKLPATVHSVSYWDRSTQSELARYRVTVSLKSRKHVVSRMLSSRYLSSIRPGTSRCSFLRVISTDARRG